MMALFDNLSGILQHNIGIVFGGLLLLLAALSGVYWLLLVRRRKESFLATMPDRSLEATTAAVKTVLQSVVKSAPVESNVAASESSEYSISQPQGSPASDSERGEDVESLLALSAKLKRAREAARDMALPDNESDSTDSVVEAGISAMAEGRWEQARNFFEEGLKLSPDAPEIHIKLAIACYELGDLLRAEQHYNDAVRAHPLAAKAFRKHLAFRV